MNKNTPLYIMLACGILVLLAGLYIISEYGFYAQIPSPSRFSGRQIPVSAPSVALIGISICIYPVYQLLRRKRDNWFLYSEKFLKFLNHFHPFSIANLLQKEPRRCWCFSPITSPRSFHQRYFHNYSFIFNSLLLFNIKRASAFPMASSTGWWVCFVFRKCLKFSKIK